MPTAPSAGTSAVLVARNTDAVQVVHVPLPDDVKLPPRPRQGESGYHYQRVLLNIRTGALSFFCADWRVHIPFPKEGEDRTRWDSQHPGVIPTVSAGIATKPVPELLSFIIDTWTPIDWPADEQPPTPAWVYLTREQGEGFAASLAPLAQRLVDNLFRVPGSDDLEWSAESVAALRAIDAACDRHHQGPRDGDVSQAGLVNFADAVATVPDLVRGDWADMNDAMLDRVADALNRGAGRLHPQLAEKFGKPYADGSGIGLDLYGARSWLYAYRAHEADHRPILDAADWFTHPAHTLTRRITANDTDDDLAAFAAREHNTASRDGIKLVGIERIVRTYRDELRAHIFDHDLPRARQAVERLQQATSTRAGLLGQIIGWGDPRYHSDNDSVLARRAGMTHHDVTHLRTVLTDTGDSA